MKKKVPRAHHAYEVSGHAVLQESYLFLKSNAPYLLDGQNLWLYPSKYQRKQHEKLPRFFFLI